MRTATVTNGNAFNSFQSFSVPAATTANLHVPTGATNLINIVRDQRTSVDGILNAMKDGRIGGNVWFANPHGFVVGNGGVVNVGSLTLATPTQQFVDAFFSAPGTPDESAVSRLLSGTAPRSGTGAIDIRGTINAIDGINLSAGTIRVGGTLFAGARFLGDVPALGQVVNVNGLESAGNVIAQGGRIRIVADGDVTIAGTVAAPGAPAVAGGDIRVQAGGNVDLRPGALVSVRGNGENSPGGNVYIFGDNRSTFAAGAVIDASAGASGNGGAIELSARNTVALDGGQFRASATAGEAGSVLIDPQTVTITANVTPNDGAAYSVVADDSITVAPNVIISTRRISADDQTAAGSTPGLFDTAASVGGSGSITFTAPNITLGAGARLLAHTTGTFSAGDISLVATRSDQMAGFRTVEAGTRIDIAGATLKGRNISATATALAGYDWGGDPDAIAVRAATDAILGTFGFAATGVNVGVAIAKGSAEVLVGNGSTLVAQGSGGTRGSVVLAANTTARAEHMKVGLDILTGWAVGGRVFNAGFVYGEVGATATVNVAAGASITAGSLNLKAVNNATTDLTVIGISKDTTLNAAGVVNRARVESSAAIAAGAAIDVNQNVSVIAHNQNRFGASATSMALNLGKVGIAVNYTELDTRATASSGANLTSSGLANVRIEALDDTVKNKSSASTAAGSSALASMLVVPLLELSEAGLNKLLGKPAAGPQQLDSAAGGGTPKLGAAVTYADNTHAATAFIGAGAQVTATQDVVVAAKVNDQRIRTHATASIDGKKDDPLNPGISLGLGGAVAVGLFRHDADAYVGDNARVTARNIGVVSDFSSPYEVTWAKWEGISTIFSKLNSNLGIGDGLLSGWSNAAAGGCTGTCLAGSVTWLDYTNTSTARIGRGAELRNSPGGSGAWSATLLGDSSAFVGTNGTTIPDTRSQSFASPFHVLARSDSQGVYVAGNMSLLLNGAGGEPGSTAVGGAYNQFSSSTTTRAWIAEGAVVAPAPDGGPAVNVTVQADSRTQVTSVAPSAGRGASYGGSVIFSQATVDDRTEASIDDEARVTGARVDIKAGNDAIVWSLAGAINSADSAGVGAGIAFSKVTTDTRAAIRDNDALNAGGSQHTLATGRVSATSLAIDARTDGRIESIAVAGAAATSDANPNPGDPPGLLDQAKSGLFGLLAKVPVLGDKFGASTPAAGPPPSSPFGIAIAGSSAVNRVELGTRAYVDGGTVEMNSTGATSLVLRAVNDTDITAAAGSAALVRANNPSSSFSAGVAGSVAVNLIGNTTEAYLKSATVTNAEDVTVNALTGGEQLSVAIAATVNASSEQTRAGSFAGSVSVSEAANTTSARVESTTLTGRATGSGRDASIVAYDRIYLGTGGGSLIAGGKAGLGAAVTFSKIANTTEAAVDAATITQYDTMRVQALTAGRIGAGAGMGGGSWADNGVSLGGAFVVSQIDNTVKSEIRNGASVTAGSLVEVLAADTTGNASLDALIDSRDGGNANSVSLDYNGTTLGQSAGAGSSIISVAGVLQVSSGGNAGMSFAYNRITNDFGARLLGSNVSAGTSGTVNVLAQSSASMMGLAVGLGVSTSRFAGSGSLTLNEIENTVIAEIASPSSSSLITASALTVKAEDRSRSFSLAGNVSLSGGNAAIGAAVGVSSIENTVRATVDGVVIDARATTDVRAKSDANIRTYAASVAAATGSGASLSGSAASSTISNTTEASIRNASADDLTNAVKVSAEDTSSIRSLAGGVAVQLGSGGAVGAAVAVNTIGNSTQAYVSGSPSGTRYAVKDLQVAATSANAVDTIAVGVGGGVNVGVGGSVAVNKTGGNTSAFISGGADVEAENNVGVIAQSDDAVQVLAGAGGIGLTAAGVGASVTVNRLDGTTEAYVSGASTKVSARGKDLGSTMTIASGRLTAPVDLGSALSLATYDPANYVLSNRRETLQVSGLAVNASASHSVATQAKNIAGGTFAGVAGTTAVNLIGGSTTAYISAARINGGVNSTAGAGQSVVVSASDHAYGTTFIGSLSLGAAGVGLAVDTSIFDRDTRAYVTGSTLDAKAGTGINAYSTQGVSSLVVGAAGGAAGVVGTGSVARFTSETVAYVSGSTLTTGLLGVVSDHDSRVFVAGGAAGAGGAGVAGTFAVADVNGTTQAYIDGSTVNTSGAVSVLADDTTELRNWGISGAAGGAAGVAGAVVVALVDNTVRSYVTGSTIGSSTSRAGRLAINARDTLDAESTAGAGGIGVAGAGAGAGVAVTRIDNSVAAYLENSSAYTSGDIEINTAASRDIASFSVAVGAGGSSGISGSVGLITVGAALTADANGELGSGSSGTRGALQSFAGGDRLGSGNVRTTAGTDLSSSDVTSLNAAGAVNTNAALSSGAFDNRTSARIVGGASHTVDAGGNLVVSAVERDRIDLQAGSVAVGGIGLGASVAVVNVTHNVEARIDGQVTARAATGGAGRLEVLAETGRKDVDATASRVRAWQGSGGLLAAAGAAVATNSVTNNVTAAIGRGVTASVQSGSGDLRVTAADAADVDVQARGYTVGAVAAGAVVARADKAGTVAATVSDTAASGASTTIDPADGQALVSAQRSGAVNAYTQAGAGGVLAGSGSDAQASDTGAVLSFIGGNAVVRGGPVSVQAIAEPRVTANAEGYGGALYANVGVAIARATASPVVSASLGSNVDVDASQVGVNAIVRQSGALASAESRAVAAGAGGLVGVNATESTAESRAIVSATVGTGTDFAVTGNVTIAASNATRQSATASGNTVSGLAAAGATLSNARSDSTTTAIVSNGVTGFADGTLAVTAAGSDNTYAETFSGSGGVVAGAGATANTRNLSATTATLGGGTSVAALRSGAIVLKAEHTATFNGQVDSLQAAVLGASGAVTRHDTDATVTARIADGANLGTQALTVLARNLTRKPWLDAGAFNARAGAGGLLNGAAAVSYSTVDNVTQALIGDGAATTVNVTGDRSSPGASKVEAINDVELRDKSKLDVGGYIAVARAESELINNNSATVSLAPNAQLITVGAPELAARTRADLESNASARTYGLAGAAEGKSKAFIGAITQVHTGAGSRIRADGDINLAAGEDASGLPNDLRAVARTDLFNKTALPIPAVASAADARIAQSNSVRVDGAVDSVGDVYLTATRGGALASGTGTGKDLYRQIVAEIGSAISGLFGGGEVSLDVRFGTSNASTTGDTTGVTVNGVVSAGIQNKQRLVIGTGAAGQDDSIVEQSEGVRVSFSNENIVTNMLNDITRLTSLRAQYAGDPDAVAAYDAEIGRVRNELVQQGFATPDGVPVVDITSRFINVGEVRARGGDVNIRGEFLAGSGSVRAPNDTEISIINRGANSLRTTKLTIEDRGGKVRFNDAELATAPPGFGGSIVSAAAGGPTPVIRVENSFNPFIADRGDREPDIQITGDVSNNGTSGRVEIANATGSILVQGVGANAAPSITASTINVSAGKNFVQAYVNGFSHVGGDPRLIWADIASGFEAPNIGGFAAPGPFTGISNAGRVGTGSIIAGNNVFISAARLNINGTVQSGLPDRTIEIDANRPGYLFGQQPIYASVQQPDPYAYHRYLRQVYASIGYPIPGYLENLPPPPPPLQVLTGYTPATVGNLGQWLAFKKQEWESSGRPANTRIAIPNLSGNIAAVYNPATQRIEVDNVTVQGGYMELFGAIMNTGGGQLKVMDGFGRIQVSNTTGVPLQLNVLDTGGNGIEGKIRITDTNYRYLINGENRPVTHVITRIGANIQENAYAGDVWLASNSLANARSGVSYAPLANLRYVWQTGQDYSLKTVGTAYENSALGFIPSGSGSYNSFVQTQLSAATLDAGEFQNVGAQGSQYTYGFQNRTTSESAVTRKEWSECIRRFIGCLETRYWVEDTRFVGTKRIHTHSLRADNAIPISFIGYDSGSVQVTSNSDIIVANAITNRGGSTMLTTTSGAIAAETTRPIGTESASLGATRGIGDVNNALNLDLRGGTLRAVTGIGDVVLKNVNPTSQTRVDLVSSNSGNVRLESGGDIVAADNGLQTRVAGRRVELVSNSGGIGAAGQALAVQTEASAGNGLFARAANSISISQASGDLMIDRVESVTGDVTLIAATGSIIDGNAEEQRDTRTESALTGLWNDMLLTGAGADQGFDTQVGAIRRQKETDYRSYWALRNVQPVRDGNGVITGYTADAYNPGYAYVPTASEVATLSPAQLSTWVASRTAAYHDTHARLGAAPGAISTPVAGLFDANYSYALTQAERDNLSQNNSFKWTENELRHAVSRSVFFKQTTDTETRIETANVKGRNITLTANAGSVGRNNGEEVISRTANVLTSDQRIALAAAEADDVAVEQTVIRVFKRDDLDIQLLSGGNLTVNALNNVFLGSQTDINVQTVSAGAGIRIKGDGNLYSVMTSGPAITQTSGAGQAVILESASGAIGTAANPIRLSLQSSTPVSARSASGVFLDTVAGDLRVAEMFSLGNVGLGAARSILDARGTRAYAIQAANVALTPRAGSIGTSTEPLYVLPGSSLTGTTPAGQGVYLTVPGNFDVGGLVSGGDARLEAAGGDLRLNSLSVASGTATLVASGSILNARSDSAAAMTALNGNFIAGTGSIGSSEAPLAVNLTGSMTSAAVTRTRIEDTAGAFAVSSATTTAGDTELRARGGALTITSASARDNLVLQAEGGISATTLNTTTGNINATASTGDVSLGWTNAAGAATLVATTGNVKVDTVSAVGDVNVTAAQSIGGKAAARYAQVESTAGSVTLNAGTDISGDLTRAAQNVQATAARDLDAT
ncbi:MAG: leukotoxin LktA family filamentous adhesin, partial [Rhodocyclaceae bacterium]|nr:leukotoxin LktA family filamentous adhesin [Rhodocyclaceae bacterium]